MENAWIIVSQLVTAGTACCMFRCIIGEKDKNRKLSRKSIAVLTMGTLIYLLLPEHMNVVIHNRDRTQILLWMLIPVLAVALMKMASTEIKIRKCCFGMAAVLVMGLIGRLDGVAGLTILFLVCVAGICRKQWQYPVIGALGIVMAYPTYITWKHWLFDGSFAESGLEYGSIMYKGYSIGGLFSTYFHRNGDPGMGILLLGGIMVLIYFSFVKGRKLFNGTDAVWLASAGLLTIMSLRYFPWDLVQRIGNWALGLVTLIRTPTVFFTYAQMILCVMCVEKIGKIMIEEEAGQDADLEKAV